MKPYKPRSVRIECPKCGDVQPYWFESREIDTMVDVGCDACGLSHTVSVHPYNYEQLQSLQELFGGKVPRVPQVTWPDNW